MAFVLAFLLAIAPLAVIPVTAQAAAGEQSIVAASSETLVLGTENGTGQNADLLIRRWDYDGTPASAVGLAKATPPANWQWQDATFTPDGFDVTLQQNEWLGFHAQVANSDLPENVNTPAAPRGHQLRVEVFNSSGNRITDNTIVEMISIDADGTMYHDFMFLPNRYGYRSTMNNPSHAAPGGELVEWGLTAGFRTDVPGTYRIQIRLQEWRSSVYHDVVIANINVTVPATPVRWIANGGLFHSPSGWFNNQADRALADDGAVLHHYFTPANPGGALWSNTARNIPQTGISLTNPGFRLAGWSLTDDSDDLFLDEDFGFVNPPTSSIVPHGTDIYAIWEGTHILFDANGGEFTWFSDWAELQPNREIVHDGTVFIFSGLRWMNNLFVNGLPNSVNIARPGYVLHGWSTSTDGADLVADSAGILVPHLQPVWQVEYGTRFYAIWRPVVQANANGGRFVLRDGATPDARITLSENDTIASHVIPYGESIWSNWFLNSTGLVLNRLELVKEGYRHLGWAFYDNATEPYINLYGQRTSASPWSWQIVDGGSVFYAVWEELPVRFLANGGTFEPRLPNWETWVNNMHWISDTEVQHYLGFGFGHPRAGAFGAFNNVLYAIAPYGYTFYNWSASPDYMVAPTFPTYQGQVFYAIWESIPTLELSPNAVTIDNDNLNATVAVGGNVTSAITVSPTSINLTTGVSLVVVADSGNNTVTVLLDEPPQCGDDIMGRFTVIVERGGLSANITVNVNFTPSDCTPTLCLDCGICQVCGVCNCHAPIFFNANGGTFELRYPNHTAYPRITLPNSSQLRYAFTTPRYGGIFSTIDFVAYLNNGDYYFVGWSSSPTAMVAPTFPTYAGQVLYAIWDPPFELIPRPLVDATNFRLARNVPSEICNEYNVLIVDITGGNLTANISAVLVPDIAGLSITYVCQDERFIEITFDPAYFPGCTAVALPEYVTLFVTIGLPTRSIVININIEAICESLCPECDECLDCSNCKCCDVYGTFPCDCCLCTNVCPDCGVCMDCDYVNCCPIIVTPPTLILYPAGPVTINNANPIARIYVGGTAAGQILATAPNLTSGTALVVNQANGIVAVGFDQLPECGDDIIDSFTITVTRGELTRTIVVNVNIVLANCPIICGDCVNHPCICDDAPIPCTHPNRCPGCNRCLDCSECICVPWQPQPPLHPQSPLPPAPPTQITPPSVHTPTPTPQLPLVRRDRGQISHIAADYVYYDELPPATGVGALLPPALVSNILIFTANRIEFLLNHDTLIAVGAPFIEPTYDRMMIPLRSLAVATGLTVEWDSFARAVRLYLPTGLMLLPVNEPLPNNLGMPMIVGDRVFVPLRFVMYELEKSVHWDSVNRAGIITW